MTSIIFASITLMFFMFFIWICILSIRLSIAYKLITRLYEEMNIQSTQEQYENTSILPLPPLSINNKKVDFKTTYVKSTS